MEGIVEYRYLRRMRHQLIDGTQTTQVTGIVDGCKIDKALDAVFNFLGDDAALLEEVATLHDTVADCINLVEALQCSDFRVKQYLEDECHTFLVGREVGHYLPLLAVVQFHLDERLVKSDTFNTTLSQHRLICHVVQLVLNGTATAVQY